jgi:3-oxoadipate enol-lactonase
MTGRFAAPSGREMFVEEAGAGRPLLAVHGVGGGAWFFRGLADRLGPGWRVLSIDLPGTGRSTGSAASLTLEGWVADLGALVAERVGEPVVIVGHSLGTILALEAWRAWPRQIAGLVFVGGLPEPRPAICDRLRDRLRAMSAESGLDGWGVRISPGNFSPASFRDRPEVVGLFERLFELQRPDAYTRSVEILLGASAADVVPTVTVPVCSVSGADDQYAPPDAVRAFLSRLPRAPQPIILPDVGHLPFFEAPEAFARAVRAFLEDSFPR